MKAAVVRERSGPFIIEELREPQPKAGEILVEVAACGVCHTDLHIHDGSVPFPLPCVLGHEVSGTVAAVGEGVERLSPGDRVAGAFIMPCGSCEQCSRGREELCEPFFAYNRLKGTLYDGETRLFTSAGRAGLDVLDGRAQRVRGDAGAGGGPDPDGLPTVESSIFGCALLTSFGAVHHVGRLEPGETVAVLGTGGVGVEHRPARPRARRGADHRRRPRCRQARGRPARRCDSGR